MVRRGESSVIGQRELVTNMVQLQDAIERLKLIAAIEFAAARTCALVIGWEREE